MYVCMYVCIYIKIDYIGVYTHMFVRSAHSYSHTPTKRRPIASTNAHCAVLRLSQQVSKCFSTLFTDKLCKVLFPIPYSLFKTVHPERRAQARQNWQVNRRVFAIDNVKDAAHILRVISEEIATS